MIQKYRSWFKNVQAWALRTALFLFILYLLLFMGTCYGFTWMPGGSFQKLFEKYFILSIGIYMVFLFGLSATLVYFTINPKTCYLLIWLKIFIATASLYVIAALSGGIYITVEGNLTTGLVLIITTIFLAIIKTHSILITSALYKERTEANSDDVSVTSNE